MKRYQLTSNLLLVALIFATTGAASGQVRVERVAIAHEYGQQNAITLGNERYVLTALP